MKKFLLSPKTHVIAFCLLYAVACSQSTTHESQDVMNSDIHEFQLSDGTKCVAAEMSGAYSVAVSIQCNFK